MSDYKEYTVRVYDNKKTEWLNSSGLLHREDGPAFEHSDGSKSWFLNGELHREDGPAVEYSDGYKAWYLNGKYHREDGPVIEWADGSKHWYLNGDKLTEEEFKSRTQTCAGRVVEIDGLRYKLELVK